MLKSSVLISLKRVLFRSATALRLAFNKLSSSKRMLKQTALCGRLFGLKLARLARLCLLLELSRGKRIVLTKLGWNKTVINRGRLLPRSGLEGCPNTLCTAAEFEALAAEVERS